MQDIELKFKNICDWIIQNGGYVNPKLKLIDTGSTGRAVITTEDIQNEDLFSVPKKIHLNPENCQLNLPNFQFKEQVVICLLRELFVENSFYLPYLELLPKLESFENHPIVLFMNGKFPRVSEFIYERAAANYQDFLNFYKNFMEFNKVNLLVPDSVKMQGILWAYLNVTTRMWSNVGLVPFADLLQHSNDSNVALDSTDEYSKMKTTTIIKSGSIVYDNYLIQDDISLYLNFGFVDSSNLHYTSLNFRFDRKPGLLTNIIESELNRNTFNKIFISSEGINQILISFLRINMLNEKDIRNIDFDNPEYLKNIISISNELRCLKKLKFRISHLLDYNELEWAKTNIDILQESTEKDICKLILKLNSIKISIDKIISDYWLSFLNNTDN